MFVKSNHLIALLPYYKNELNTCYEPNEIENIYYLVCDYKHGLNKLDVKINNPLLSESELLMHRSIVKRLKQNEPIQHIIEEVEFYGIPLKVTSDVLVPRPETEELVALVLSEIENKAINVLDIGTGSGCIPISLKKNLPQINMYAVDVSENALSVAKHNAIKNQVDIQFIEKDILKHDLSDLPMLDVIISNPPYVLESDKKEMNKNVLDFDPHLALFVKDETPLLFYERITLLASKKLNSGGYLYFEIHEKFGEQIKQLMADFNFKNIRIIKDLQEKDRIIVGKLD